MPQCVKVRKDKKVEKFHFIVGADAGDDILQGFEHQLQEQAEDVTPYYMQQNSHSSTSYPYITYEVPPYYDDDLDTTYLLSWVLIFLGLLILICTIIMIVLCVKVCCHETPIGVPNGTPMVPPPFIYVHPFMNSSQLQSGNNHITPNMTNVQNTFHE